MNTNCHDALKLRTLISRNERYISISSSPKPSLLRGARTRMQASQGHRQMSLLPAYLSCPSPTTLTLVLPRSPPPPLPREGVLWAPEVFQEHPRDSYNCGLRKVRQGPWPWRQKQMTRAQGWSSATGRSQLPAPPPIHPLGQPGPYMLCFLSPQENGQRAGRGRVRERAVREETGREQMTSPLWVSGRGGGGAQS